MVVLLYYRIIVLFAGERIFKIGTLLAKLQAKWFDCFACPFWGALSWWKVQISPDNLRMMDNRCYSLLLFLKQSNSESNSESELTYCFTNKMPILPAILHRHCSVHRQQIFSTCLGLHLYIFVKTKSVFRNFNCLRIWTHFNAHTLLLRVKYEHWEQ